MVFFIRIQNDTVSPIYKCEIIYSSTYIEHIMISNEGCYIVLQSNRPLLLCKGMKYNKIQWNLIEGNIENKILIDLITSKIEETL